MHAVTRAQPGTQCLRRNGWKELHEQDSVSTHIHVLNWTGSFWTYVTLMIFTSQMKT